MSRQLLVFATELEAKETIHALNAIQEHNGVFSFAHGKLLVTGIGALAASTLVMLYGAGASLIWNIGIAGALDDALSLGEIYEVASVSRHINLPMGIDQHSLELCNRTIPTITIQQHGIHLATADYPVHRSNDRSEHLHDAQLIDMEGYGVAFAAQQLGIPCQITKYVSDFAREGGPRLIQKQLVHASKQLAETTVAR